MHHSRYKYFSQIEYAERFLKGEMYHQTAAYFRDYEDRAAQQIVGDEYEGTGLYRPVNGFEVHNVTRGTDSNLQRGLECLTRADEIFIFCVSLSLNDVLKRELQAVACVEITVRERSSSVGAKICRRKPRKTKSTSQDGLHIIGLTTCRGT